MPPKSAAATPGADVQQGPHQNKLTQCFDDILKISTEMMVQQQLKNVQLDSYMVNGYTTAQAKNLREKVYLFHRFLDDLETNLSKSSAYVDALYALGKQQVDLKRQQEEEMKRKQEEEEKLLRQQREKEEADRKRKEKEEEAKRQQVEASNDTKQQQPQSQPQQSMDLNLGFDMTTMGGYGNNGKNVMSPSVDSNMPTVAATDAQSIFGDLNSMEMSMLTGFDAESDFNTPATVNMNDHNTSMNNNNNTSIKNNNNNANSTDNNSKLTSTQVSTDLNMAVNNNPSIEADNDLELKKSDELGMANYLNDEPSNATDNAGLTSGLPDNDDYLTLNDFNDLNIDWTAGGDNGEMDLNGFNI